MKKTVPPRHRVLIEETDIAALRIWVGWAEHSPRATPVNINRFVISTSSIIAQAQTHPPSQAIFKFLLKKGFKSHADNPPGIDASAHIFSSVNDLQATRFSLFKTKAKFDKNQSHCEIFRDCEESYLAYTWEPHDETTACGTGCSTHNIRITNCFAMSGMQSR